MLLIHGPEQSVDLKILKNTIVRFIQKLTDEVSGDVAKVPDKFDEESAIPQITGIPTPKRIKEFFAEKAGGEGAFSEAIATMKYMNLLHGALAMFDRNPLTEDHVNQIFSDLITIVIEEKMSEEDVLKISELLDVKIIHQASSIGAIEDENRQKSSDIIEKLIQAYEIIGLYKPSYLNVFGDHYDHAVSAKGKLDQAIQNVLSDIRGHARVVTLHPSSKSEDAPVPHQG